jgi:hypothetical protein
MSIAAATTCCSSPFPSNPSWHATSYSRAARLPLPRPAWRRSLLAASPPARRLRIRPRTSASASPATAYDYEVSNRSLLDYPLLHSAYLIRSRMLASCYPYLLMRSTRTRTLQRARTLFPNSVISVFPTALLFVSLTNITNISAGKLGFTSSVCAPVVNDFITYPVLGEEQGHKEEMFKLQRFLVSAIASRSTLFPSCTYNLAYRVKCIATV